MQGSRTTTFPSYLDVDTPVPNTTPEETLFFGIMVFFDDGDETLLFRTFEDTTKATMGIFSEEVGVPSIESIADTTSTLGTVGLIKVCNKSTGHPNGTNVDDETMERGVASMGSKEMGFPANSPLFNDEGRMCRMKDKRVCVEWKEIPLPFK